MKNKYFVIDFGGTSTKALHYEGQRIFRRYCFESEQYACSQFGIHQLLVDLRVKDESLTALVITGGKSHQMQNSLQGLNTICIDEIDAIGVGGLLAVPESKALVVSIGTGTAIVIASLDKKQEKKYHIQHAGGLALGGGTIMGLGKLLCDVQSFNELESLAVRGQSDRVDLLVSDIVGGSIGIVPADLTASNFERVARTGCMYSKADISAGLFTLVGQSIARLAIVLAKQEEIESIVVIGQVIENTFMQEVFMRVQKIFSGKLVFVSNSRYRVAEGAFTLAFNEISKLNQWPRKRI